MKKKNTRILFLISRFLDGGIDTVLVDYLQFLSCDPTYHITLAIGTYMGDLEVFTKNIPESIVVKHLVKHEWLTKWRRLKITKKRLSQSVKLYDEIILSPIRRYIIANDIRELAATNDIIIDFDCCFYSYLKSISTPKIAWFHFSFEQSLRQNRRRTLRIGHLLEQYDQVVCISEAMRQEGISLFPNLADKLCVIYNAKNREIILNRASQQVKDIRINKPFILAVERLEESQKDLSTLLQAWKIYKEKYHHTEQLYLLGKGNSQELLQQLASQLGIANDVVFLGFSNNPYPWILKSKLLVHSAKFEGLPTVLTEGLMLNKLMVATDCPTGPREILAEGRAGLLVPVGDVQAVADAMHRLMTDTFLQTEILQGVKQQQKAFSFQSTSLLFKELITKVENH